MADVVPFRRASPPPKSPDVHDVAVEYWKAFSSVNGQADDNDLWERMMADNLLGFLWNYGFKVVPLDPGDAPYEGPDWTGDEVPSK